jgi:hypothetical protein
MMKLSFSQLVKRAILSVLTIAFVFANSFAQSSYSIQFQDETIQVSENITSFQWSQMPEYSKLNNGYYGWVQFYETPSQAIQDNFRSLNLQLLEYIPHRTYLFYFPENTSITLLRDSGVRAIMPVNGILKLSSPIKNPPYPDYAVEGDQILVTLEHHKTVSTQFVINDLAAQLITVTQQYENSDILELSIPNNCLEILSNLAYVKWIELINAPPVVEDSKGRNLHRTNGLDTQTMTGRNYTGEGVGVLVRDDGSVGPHIDFTGRLTNIAVSGGGTHGDRVSGTLSGAGNLNPGNMGMARGSELFVVDYAGSFLDSNTTGLINDGSIQITNSSYGDGCNDGYNSRARTVDSQINTEPTLLHVFSTGNSGTSNCGYGAGSGWGNITGGHKQGKNVIAVASTDFSGDLSGFSSRGPATDGRIKPDIAAHGEDVTQTTPNNNYTTSSGTSFSAPGLAGVSAQLYQVYMEANGGTLPQSALIKAALLNTASDYGNMGPDYKFGWGVVNGLRAGLLVEDGRYLSDNISQGDTNNHTIAIPTGAAQVRFMVYWNDPAATAGASPALVNDLDLVVTDPSSGTHLPWILDPTPNATNLNLPATNGIDHLNNMEQVLLNNPAAGNYDIEISGFNVPVGPQEYFVVYEIISEKLTLTYPNGGESFQPFATESIHWDAVNTAGNFDLEYSSNNGGSWNAIATVNASLRNYAWTAPPPGEVGGEYLVRVSSGGDQDQSDANFNVAQFPTVLTIVQVCPTEAELQWNPIPDAESYDVYTLGDKYMEIVGTSNTASITIPITDPLEPLWFAVVAKNTNLGWESARSTAKGHSGGLLNCVLATNEFDASSLSLYPNPAAQEFTINLGDNSSDNIDVSIFNSLGQQLNQYDQSVFNDSSQASFDISSFASGLYFITIKSDGITTTKKLLIK